MMRIGEFALASGLTVKALRNIGLALDTVVEASSNPHYINSFIEGHRAHVADERARQDADAAQGSALIDSLELDYTVHRRSMPAQHWVGIQHEIRDLELEQVQSPLATLQIALTEAGHTISGPWWTTLRQTAEAEVVEVLFCWPTAQMPAEPIGISGTIVESGTLPARDELFVTLETSDDDSDLGDLGAEAAQVAMIEQANADGLKLVHGSIRQVGVLADDGTPEAIELVIAIQ